MVLAKAGECTLSQKVKGELKKKTLEQGNVVQKCLIVVDREIKRQTKFGNLETHNWKLKTEKKINVKCFGSLLLCMTTVL